MLYVMLCYVILYVICYDERCSFPEVNVVRLSVWLLMVSLTGLSYHSLYQLQHSGQYLISVQVKGIFVYSSSHPSVIMRFRVHP